MDEYTVTLTKIREGGDSDYRTIEFNPPLTLSVYEGEFGTEAETDFGMRFRVGWRSVIFASYPTVEEKIQAAIEFELFHAFFHPHEDPNYSVLNWALYGNLKDRVTTDEQYQ